LSHDHQTTAARPTFRAGPFTRRELSFGLAAVATLAPLAAAAQTAAPKPQSAAPSAPPANHPAPTQSAAPKPPAPSAAELAAHLQPDQRATLTRALADAESHGFGHAEFMPEDKSGDEALVAAVIAYARAQHGGRITDWPKDWALRPASYDAERELAFALHQNNLQAWLDSLPPPFERYRALRTALVNLRNTPAPKPKRALKPKAAATGDGDPHATSGVATLLPAAQADTLRANMERWRWMPRNLPADRIEVNTASATLAGYRGNQVTLTMLAAAGKPKDETPILTSQIESIVLNPVWHVPDSIAKKELFPKNHRHPGYLRSHGFQLVKREGQTRIEQKSGAKNALGSIKFDFPNAFAVYLHDTPSHGAFNRNARDVSHGCVRLQNPYDLAGFVFQGDAQWNEDSIKAAQAKEDTQRVPLPRPMPVFLLYWTAAEGADHNVAFVKDVYGWDAKLLQLLAAGVRHA